MGINRILGLLVSDSLLPVAHELKVNSHTPRTEMIVSERKIDFVLFLIWIGLRFPVVESG